MAEERFQQTSTYEVQTSDINNMSDNAGLADDRVLAELLRVAVYNGASVAKAIVPFAISGADDGANGELIASSGAADGSVVVSPFRAIVGALNLPGDVGSSGLDQWRDIRSAVCAGAHDPTQTVALDATVTSNRWDLIYARVDRDMDAATVTRYVKSPSGSVSAGSVSTRKQNIVTLGVVKGSEAGFPTRPALPADAAGAYYIALGYVLLEHPFTATTIIDGTQSIFVAAPCLPLSRATGAATVAPAKSAWDPVGAVQTGDQAWDVSGGNGKTLTYMPPTMVGSETRWIAIDHASPAFVSHVDADVVDDSIDWRNRLFEWHAFYAETTSYFAWQTSAGHAALKVPSIGAADGGFSALGQRQQIGFGQSFQSDMDTGYGRTGAMIMVLAPGNMSVMPAGAPNATVGLYVDMTTGALKLYRNAKNADGRFMVRVTASAPRKDI